MIRLKEILALPVFSEFKVVAGLRGLDREVSTVSVMDAPDIYKWMKGGEFLITTGYVIKDMPEYVQSLIVNLDKNGAAALGVKFDRFIHAFPEEALRTADELQFPIVAIPFEFAFTDVINPVLREVVNQQARKMMYTEHIHENFTRMVLSDEAISNILVFLKQNIHREVALVDTCFCRVYFADENSARDEKLSSLKGLFDSAVNIADVVHGFYSYHLHTSQEEYGYIVIGGELEEYDVFFDDYYKIAIEQAGIVLILKIQRMLAASKIEEDYREQFVQDMISGNIASREEIMNRATIYNWNFHAGGIVVIVDVDHFKQQYLENLNQERNAWMEKTMHYILLTSKRVVKRQFTRFVYSRLSDRVVFIISEAHDDEKYFMSKLKETFREVQREVAAAVSFTATIGMGSYRSDIGQIHDSWEEARKAVSISRSMGRENVLSVYDELGAFKLLALINTSREAKDFCRQYIKKLEQYDARYSTEMLPTLSALIACGWNMKEASERLFIHYNSMKYRCRKISSILKVDLQDQEQRLNLELALKLYQINMS